MTTDIARIGKTADGSILKLDTARLVDTRALIQGSSGSGKSWLIRLIVEKVAAKMPVLMLDLEGEFATLREKFDFVLAGEGGEVAVDVRSAGLLARKLLELKLSGVVSLFDLTPPQKRAYVRAFLESIMAAPRALWSPRLIVLDEAHAFAPESTQAESLPAVIDLASRGRKRGYCLIAATQRLSKLHKDVAAEMRNVFVGQTTLDVDVKRALDTLGFPVDLGHKRELRALDHEFYAMGPATSAEGVVLFKADAVKTTHPESGLRRTLSPPAASKAIRNVLGELADLPKEAEQEAKDLAGARREIQELKRQLSGKAQPAPKMIEKPVRDQAAIDREVAVERRHWQGELSKVQKSHAGIVGRMKKIEQLAHLNGEVAALAVHIPAAPKAEAKVVASTAVARPIVPRREPRESIDPDSIHIGGGALRMLHVLTDRAPARFTESQWASLSQLKRSGGTWGTYKSKLVVAGLVEQDRATGLWGATDDAIAQYGDASRAPQSAAEIREDWKRKLGSGPAKMIDALVEFGECSREELAERVGIEKSGGTFGTYLSKLRSNGIVIDSGGVLAIVDSLVD